MQRPGVVVCLASCLALIGIALWGYAGLAMQEIGVQGIGQNDGGSGADHESCSMTTMNPTFNEVLMRNVGNTRRYALYQYNENHLEYQTGVHQTTKHNERALQQLGGMPVIFIPGNAGSYKQVRSLASEVTRSAWVRAQEHPEELYPTHFDFYTVDFKEELSAFSAELLEKQAQFVSDCVKTVLEREAQAVRKRGCSGSFSQDGVILIGHSMGGVIARMLPSLKSFQAGSVSIILTLSSPHRL